MESSKVNCDPGAMEDELSLDSAGVKKPKTRKSPKEERRQHFTIEWRHLTYHHRLQSAFSQFFAKKLTTSATGSGEKGEAPKRTILNSLDGRFKSGELTAILGPSGAGKTTFLSCLFGSKQEQALGRTRVTWQQQQEPVKESSQKRSRSIRSAMLPQHDHLLNHLTVYETLMFASKIKNAARRRQLGSHFHRLNVRRVAKMLKLQDCLETRCGKLSGGQYKRVSIGQELLSEPDVIVLDEPTSGLDAMTCLSTVQTLKSIVSGRPMSIILTIHQPDQDVFKLFDHVYVIAQGGLAIYEGPPTGIAPTLELVGLHMPSPTYNPARFIVEHAFVACDSNVAASQRNSNDSSEEDDEEGDEEEETGKKSSYLNRSMLSLSGAITIGDKAAKLRQSIKRPLLNIAIQTADGKLVTQAELENPKTKSEDDERLNLLRRLNAIQRSRYNHGDLHQADSSAPTSASSTPTNDNDDCNHLQLPPVLDNRETRSSSLSAKSDYSGSSGWSSALSKRHAGGDSGSGSTTEKKQQQQEKASKTSSLVGLNGNQLHIPSDLTAGRSLQTMQTLSSIDCESISSVEEEEGQDGQEFVVQFSTSPMPSSGKGDTPALVDSRKWPKRQFDKRLSAKRNCRRRRQDQPVWYHALLLMHRTWLSIVRDPIFFGIQACLHTTIPFLLAGIFGSQQDEGCPRAGHFDLVDFAYSDASGLMEQTMRSIRLSIGNIGVVFFEMFVLSFAINCITALVFPLDMYVLLKEHRNGWYSLRSYFIGRTMADLPVPLCLHSLAMSILCYMTGQPLDPIRFLLLLLLTNLASLVAQSVGLTIGAILMRSSQSAVLAAAGIVAPFFALSGFIVRIHTLPFMAQVASQASYLYHLLNGFILLRYGFGRCQCREEDFKPNEAHQIPSNLHTLASMWVGTYSNEYPNSAALINNNKTNVDPNIDVVDKMMEAFKMANSYGHPISTCADLIPYAMLDFNLRDQDIYNCFLAITLMLILSRLITFSAIYYKVRSFT